MINFSQYSFPCQSSTVQFSAAFLTEIQTNKSRERDSTLTLVSYVFPSNCRASYISVYCSPNVSLEKPNRPRCWKSERVRSNRSPKCVNIKPSSHLCGNFQASHSPSIRISLFVCAITIGMGCSRLHLKMKQLYQAGHRLFMSYLHSSLLCVLSFVIFSAPGSFSHLDHCFHTFGLQAQGCCLI